MKTQIDNLDKKILKIIAQNARVPFLEVARECNVSGAAVHQRVQKLLAGNFLKGSEFIVNTYKMGYRTCAYIGISVQDTTHHNSIVEALRLIPEIAECHFTTGKFAIFIKVYAHDNRHLLNLVVDKIIPIPGITNAETFLMSLDEVFSRQISVFDTPASHDDDDDDATEENE